MALTKADREYLNLKIKNVSEETAKTVIKGLPCEEHGKLLQEHDRVLNDGIQRSVEVVNGNVTKLEKAVNTHIKGHEKEVQEKTKGKRDFYKGVKLTLLSTMIAGFFAIMAVVVAKLIGG